MRQSFRALSFRLILAAAAALLAVPAGIAGQSPAAKPWSPPRTPDGRPDLEGIWLSKTATPLERPKALEGRASLTDEEVATLQARANRMFKEGTAISPLATLCSSPRSTDATGLKARLPRTIPRT